MKKFLALLILLTVVAVLPLLNKGFYKSHDGEWMIIRFSAFHQTLRSGQFPVRFVDRLNNNYGYPVLNFLYPLPFYLAEIPKIISFGFTDSIKIIFIASSIFSSVFMFLALREKFDNWASLTGSVIYLFLPYRFVDLYVRGSLGESVAFAVIPICLLALFKVEKKQNRYLPIFAISIALLITAHNVIAVLFLPMFIALSLILNKNLTRPLAMILLGLLISLFFWLPAIYDLQYVRLPEIEVANPVDHLVPIDKLVVPSWGYGSSPTQSGGLSTQLGLISIAVFTLSILLIVKEKKKDPFIIFLILIFALATFMMTKTSTLIWQIVPKIEIIQFPWRLLSVIVFISSVLSAFVVSQLPNKNYMSIAIIAASLFLTVSYIKPSSFVNYPDTYYSTNEDTTTVRDEYLPRWITSKEESRANSKIEQSPNLEISEKQILSADYKATISAPNDTTVQVNTIYFPGWKAYVDNKQAPIFYDNQFGLINFSLPKGTHEVIIKYSSTPIHALSEFISLASIIFTVFYTINIWRKQNF